MAKHLRIQFEGAIYHVTNRGMDRRKIGWDEKDQAGKVSFRQMEAWLKAEDVLKRVCREPGIEHDALHRQRGGAWLRGVAAEMLTKYAGLTQRQAAWILGMGTGAAVSIRQKALAKRRKEDRRLDTRLNRMDRAFPRDLLALYFIF